MLMQHDRSWVDKYDLSSLKYVMVAGENCNIAAWKWLRDVVGKNQARVVDCWWQTETGAVMMSPTPCPTDESSVPSTCTRGFYGIDPVLVDDSDWFSICFKMKIYGPVGTRNTVALLRSFVALIALFNLLNCIFRIFENQFKGMKF